MAKIEDLIAQIPNERLRKALAGEVKALKKTKKFGLVFEEHLPETVRLPLLPVRTGELVALKRESGNELWRVKMIQKGSAFCERTIEDDQILKEPSKAFPISDLVVVRSFGEPIYPALVPVDRVQRGGAEKPWHMLINADNFHALQLLLYAYEGKVDVIYIDPPYNTGARDWKYNNDYVDKTDSWRHSKWLSMMKKRLWLAKRLLAPEGLMVVTIDDYEAHHLKTLIDHEIPGMSIVGTVAIKTSPSGRPTLRGFRTNHEYAVFISTSDSAEIRTLPRSESQAALFKEVDEQGSFMWANLRKRGGANTLREARPKQFYPIYIKGNKIRVPTMEWNKEERLWNVLDKPRSGEQTLLPVGDDGKERIWSLGHETLRDALDEIRVIVDRKDRTIIQRKVRPSEEGSQPSTFWDKPQYSIVEHGTVLLERILGVTQAFPFPKSIYAVADCLRVAGADGESALILDFFSGSGTTFHSTALLNAEDEGNRRCILVTNNEVNEKLTNDLRSKGYSAGDPEFEKYGIAESVTWPRCKFVVNGKRDDGTELPGTYLSDRELKSGFAENIEYLRLDFLDPAQVARGDAFQAILPILWMIAGCEGTREDSKGSQSWFIPKGSPFAVLIKEKEFRAFREKLAQRKDIQWVFLITDSEENFASMRRALARKAECVQLYKSYLENFRLNIQESLR
jgi:adenine-specific DNA-methyltransferase